MESKEPVEIKETTEEIVDNKETNEKQETNDKKVKKEIKVSLPIIIVVLLLLLIAVGACIWYTFGKRSTVGRDFTNPAPNNEVTTTTTASKAKGKKLYNCTSEQGNAYYTDSTTYCSDIVGSITCNSYECEMVGNNKDAALINDDGLLKIYDRNSNLKKELTRFNYVDSMYVGDFYKSKSNDLIILITNSNGYVACINVDKDVYNDGIGTEYDGDYHYQFIRETNYVPVKEGLYDVTTNEINNRFESLYYYAVTIDGTDYIIGSDNKKNTIYDMDGRIRLQKPDIVGSKDNNAFYFYENKTLTKMNGSFKDVAYVNDVDEFFDVGRDYVLIAKGTKLILLDKDLNEYTTLMDNYNKKDYRVHNAGSGWWDKDDNGKEGIYIVVEITDEELIKQYEKEHPEISDEGMGVGYEYYYYPSTKEQGKIAAEIGGYAKPVLYLYPEEDTNVKVTFDKKSNLTTTYPKYINSWEVLAKPNGDLYDKNGNYYYALYWEEKKNHDISFDEGFYVESKDAIKFLEDKLSYIGLNDKERNEFIMYWLPILEKNEKNLIYFELTEERDKYSPMKITPKPDALLRIAMHVKKVNKKTNIKEQKLTSFNRSGFTAVEWGGVIH